MSTSRSSGVTAQDASALAHIASRLRAETVGCCAWNVEGTTDVFVRVLLGKNLQIATELVLAHATDPDAKTPGAITRKFTPARREPAEPAPRDREYCTVHAFRPPPPHCPACATEYARTDTDPPAQPAPLPAGTTGANAARALLGIPPKETP